MDTKILENIGLTKNEIKVYLALLEEGPSTAGKILKKAEIHNSVFHFNINRLIEKGLVSYLKKGKFKVYQAAEPDNFLTYLHDKEKEVQNILPELKARQNFAPEKMEAEIYRGLKGIMTAMNSLIEKAKKNEEFLFFSTQREENSEEIQKFYERYDAKRKEKGLITKGIAPTKLKDLFLQRKYLQMKYTNIPLPTNTGICGEKMVLISWGKNPQAVLIHSAEIVRKEKEFFHAFWDTLR